MREIAAFRERTGLGANVRLLEFKSRLDGDDTAPAAPLTEAELAALQRRAGVTPTAAPLVPKTAQEVQQLLEELHRVDAEIAARSY